MLVQFRLHGISCPAGLLVCGGTGVHVRLSGFSSKIMVLLVLSVGFLHKIKN